MATDATVPPSAAIRSANPSIAISVDAATYRRLTNFAHFMGQTYQTAATEALNEWLDTSGEAMMYCLRLRRSSRKPGKSRRPTTDNIIAMPGHAL